MITSKKTIQTVCFYFFAKVFALMKVSCFIGSHVLCFSFSNSIIPLSGAFGGITGASALLCMRFFITALCIGKVSLSFLLFFIPGFCASLCWATRSIIVHLCIPLLCIGLFILHPIGNQVFFYSFFWLIPIIVRVIPYESLFVHALASTFVAHAVGSVIWLYTTPMLPTQWISLIPFVVFERILFALGMVVMHTFLKRLFDDSISIDLMLLRNLRDKASCMYYGWQS